ncbi:1,2-diacylglycerol 3-alpha-glucosyltransferase [Pseudarthrobacter sp. W1I19]|uniref:glycosyltransferase n=1 Tax=Pseudarthrobacter sp. W1I19 TaxID=3042288 RepID=UPI00277F3788|nr:glycosyltransferase [Pseudarthrobacter sp. W1I19]MDQ0924515.1 1,2-diacylglycerol 3-alpha-glucosyltransferase [Pseudarthrobacter sp. W1I19]
MTNIQIECGVQLPRVGLFTDSAGPGYNGVNIAVAQLHEELRARGHFVAFVAPSDSKGKGRADKSWYALPSLRLPGMHPPVATGWGLFRCRRLLVQERLDVVHVHGVGLVSLFGIYFAQKNSLPLVVSWHTDLSSYLQHYGYLRPLVRLWRHVVTTICTHKPDQRMNCEDSDRRYGSDRQQCDLAIGTMILLNAADYVTAPSEKVANQLKHLGVTTPIKMIPSGADLRIPVLRSRVVDAPRRSHGHRFLYVGRITPEKGIALLLDAFSIVRHKVPNATMVLVGDYRNARRLRKRLRAAFNDSNITFVGEVERTALAEYYSNADSFVFPSTSDTQALVLHEAAQAGLPIVSVDTELLAVLRQNKNALICDATAASLAVAMTEMVALCSDSTYRNEASKVGKAMSFRYSKEQQAAATIDLYKSIIGQPDRHKRAESHAR